MKRNLLVYLLIFATSSFLLVACNSSDSNGEATQHTSTNSIEGSWYHNYTYTEGGAKYDSYRIFNFKSNSNLEEIILLKAYNTWLKKTVSNGAYNISDNKISMNISGKHVETIWSINNDVLNINGEMELKKVTSDIINHLNSATVFEKSLPISELKYKEYEKNFIERIMEGKPVDSNHLWTTSIVSTISLRFNSKNNKKYRLFITEDNPLQVSNAHYLSTKDIVSNETNTITINHPSHKSDLYALLIDGNEEAVVFPFTIGKDEIVLNIDEADPSKLSSNNFPNPNYLYYAFEDLGSTDDFDFNDVVIRVSIPDIQGKSIVDLMCAGSTMPTYLTYGTGDNPRILGSEVHAAFGVSNVKTMINTGVGAQANFPVTLGTIEGLTAQTDMSKLPFGITCQGIEGQVFRTQRNAADRGKVPRVIVVNGCSSGENAGKWFWPKETHTISDAFYMFAPWAANSNSNTDWYIPVISTVNERRFIW